MAEDRFIDEFEKLHGPYVLGELSAEERRELERHLENCPPCGRNLESARRASELLRAAASKSPSPELKDQVLKRTAD